MRYLVICKLDSPFLTPYLLFPNWGSDGGDVVCIYDIPNQRYIQYNNWTEEDGIIDWQDIEEDHL